MGRWFLMGLMILLLLGCTKTSPMTHEMVQTQQQISTAIKAFEAGDLTRAEAAYKEVIRLSPENAEGYLGLGAVYAQGGQDAEAIPQFEQAISLSPKNSRAYAGLGVARSGVGDMKGSLAALTKAVTLDGDNVTARFGLALIHLARGELLEAEKQARAIQAQNPALAESLREQILNAR